MKRLKLLRVCVAASIFTLLALFFLGLAEGFGWLAKVQPGPALVGCSLAVIALWLAVTLLFGRVFCSWGCPLGILQDLLGRLARILRRPSFTWRPGRPLVQIVAVCAFLLAGTSAASLLDPYSTYGRFVEQLLHPIADALNNLLAERLGTDGSVVLFKQEVFIRSVSGFVLALSSLVLLTIVVAWRGRLVCNTICPIGAVLGALSRHSVMSVRIDPAKCVRCGACSRACKASCLDGRAGVVDRARCVACFNCLGACAKGAISYGRPLPPPPEPVARSAEPGRPELARRTALVGLGAAAASFCFKRVTADRLSPGVCPPQGTLQRLKENCTACGLCVARCPHQVLVPAGLSDYGPFGFMMPKRTFERGFCPPGCTVCADVCPTGAIEPYNAVDSQKYRHPVAIWEAKKCLVCTGESPCGLCVRRCPGGALEARDGRIRVDAGRCTGCGACAHYCPTGSFKVGLSDDLISCAQESADGNVV